MDIETALIELVMDCISGGRVQWNFVNFLLNDLKVDPNLPNKDKSRNSLMKAVGVGCKLKDIQILHKKFNVSPHFISSDRKRTLLHEAFHQKIEVTKYLVEECKLDVNAKNIYGSSPLHRAAMYGKKKLCICLLKYGADATCKNKVITFFLKKQQNKNNTVKFYK